MVALITILVSTTSDVQLVSAISDILSPLRIVRAPVNE
jgi:energy-coupling factor transporter transmembrane protein EcfT